MLHLSSPNPPQHLHALTSLSKDTLTSRTLINQYLSSNPECSTSFEFYTGSALPRLGKDNEHPLNPMKGYLGSNPSSKKKRRSQVILDIEEEEEAYDADSESDKEDEAGTEGTEEKDKLKVDQEGTYNLIYILDAIYHFKPDIYTFLSSAKDSLSNGGIIVYTDILPPPSLNPFLRRLISVFLSVPTENLSSERGHINKYLEKLKEVGFKDVEVENWSESVWPGFARNLSEKGGVWGIIGWVVKKAEKGGWKFVAVRLKK